jgi:hypothetical protein
LFSACSSQSALTVQFIFGASSLPWLNPFSWLVLLLHCHISALHWELLHNARHVFQTFLRCVLSGLSLVPSVLVHLLNLLNADVGFFNNFYWFLIEFLLLRVHVWLINLLLLIYLLLTPILSVFNRILVIYSFSFNILLNGLQMQLWCNCFLLELDY